jgi:DNA-binding GntR family transcriptional regulator
MDELRRIEWTTEQSQTLPERIARAVRAAIVRGDLAPGSTIHVGELSRSMKVSQSPLREALRQLAGEGFVLFTPRRGVVVRKADGDESRELSDIIYVLDAFAFREAVTRMTPEALGEAERHYARLVAEPDPSRWLPILLDLRVALMSPSGRPHLVALLQTMRSHTERFTSVLYATPQGRAVMLRNWRDVIDALRSGDAGRVLAVMAASSRRTRRIAGLPTVELPFVGAGEAIKPSAPRPRTRAPATHARKPAARERDVR